MDDMKIPYLCGGVLFFLLTIARLPDGTARDHQAGLKDEHSEPILMQDLIYTFTGSKSYSAAKDTSKYKDCLIEGSSNVPFNDIAKCTIYDNTVTENYGNALKRMDEFVDWHFDPEMKRWFVKALLEIIENDSDILEDDVFFMMPDGSTVTKNEIKSITDFDLSAFLIGALHYILDKRRGHNVLGTATLNTIGEKKNRKSRIYTGNLGETITRTINVSFLPKRVRAVVAEPSVEDADKVELFLDKSDDEIIEEAMARTGKVFVSTMGALQTPKVNTDAMAGGLATVAAVAKACVPDDKQKETMVKGVSTIAAALKAHKHAIAEEIRRNSRQEKTTSSSEIPDTDEEFVEEFDQGDKKTTIIQQQTNVIQNGDNNVNMTNNGTITFNF